MHILKNQQNKLQPTLMQYFFLKYNLITKTYRLFNLKTKKIIINKIIIFNKTILYIIKIILSQSTN